MINGSELRTLPRSSKSVSGIALNADGQLAAIVMETGLLEIWETVSGKLVSTLSGSAPFSCCSMSRDGRMIAVGDENGMVHFLELVHNSETPAQITDHNKYKHHWSWWRRWLGQMLRQ